jgi:nicotinamidase-related amidase
MEAMNRALVVVDVQESFRPGLSEMHNPEITDQVARLVGAARAVGDLVVWVLHAEPGSAGAFDPALGQVEVLAELEPSPDEPRVVKTSINAFTTTNLQQTLMQHGVTELVVCGIRTDQCCETTARVAADLGYDVTFVTDATTTSAIGALSAAAIIERTERVLAARGFARIATTDDLVAGAAVVAQ